MVCVPSWPLRQSDLAVELLQQYLKVKVKVRVKVWGSRKVKIQIIHKHVCCLQLADALCGCKNR